jgi:hypothetical protein
MSPAVVWAFAKTVGAALPPLLPALFVGLVLLGVFEGGKRSERAVWEKREAARTVAQAQHDQREADRATQAALEQAERDREHTENYRFIEGVFKDVAQQFPLIHRAATGGRRSDSGRVQRLPTLAQHATEKASGPAGGERQELGCNGQAGQVDREPQRFSDDGLDGGGNRGDILTFAAVSLWNSALAGAPIAAGACQLAHPTEPPAATCAQASGISVEDALNNHRLNAQLCAADRERQRALIDFITEGGTKP